MDIYVGDKRYTPYVGSKRRKVMTEKALPYDAEIEYLQSTGTQYIDSGIKVTFPFNIKAKLEVVSGNSVGLCIMGARRNSNTNDKIVWWAQGAYASKPFALNYGSLDTGYITGTTITSGAHEFETNAADIYQDGVLKYQPSSQPNILDRDFSIYIYALNNSRGFETRNLNMKLYSIYIKNGNNEIFDAIPVRVGTTGYLYDKVSGQLFGNSGTGDFVLGQDINN